MLQQNPFYEIAALLGIAAILGALGQKLKQPLIIMFMAAGITAGPSFLGIIASYEKIELLAHMGIAILLFIVGLKLDIGLIKTTGRVALATGLGQIVFTSAIGIAIALAMGMDLLTSAYVSVVLTFSSTIIIVKLLTDKKEIDSLHGRIAVGFLIVQDVAAIIALVALTSLGSGMARETTSMTIALGAVKGLGFIAFTGAAMRWVLPSLAGRLAHSLEMLTLFSVAWAVFLGSLSDALGLSKEVGAFMAGVSLASSGYRDAIGARLTALRDFLLLFFFIDLGARLEWSTVGSQLGAAAILSLFVLVGNPLIVLAIMGMMGYRRRTAFLAGLTVAQISEFSLIVAALGVRAGHIGNETMGLVTLVGVVTILASTYMIIYSGPLYRMLSGPLKVFERKNPYRERDESHGVSGVGAEIILVGLGNYGGALAEYLLARGRTVVGVDFDPEALSKWSSMGLEVLYGDISDPDLHERLPLKTAKWVVSTVRSKDLNSDLISLLKLMGYRGKIATAAVTENDAEALKAAGAHVILRPLRDAAEQGADMLSDSMRRLPSGIRGPLVLREVRIRTGSAWAGKRLKDIDLRVKSGTNVIAVSRAERVHYDPGADFQIFPGDRLAVIGTADAVDAAESILHESEVFLGEDDMEVLVMDDIQVSEGSKVLGKTIGELSFKQRYNVTVVGIERGGSRIIRPGPEARVEAGDTLIVAGRGHDVRNLKEKGL